MILGLAGTGALATAGHPDAPEPGAAGIEVQGESASVRLWESAPDRPAGSAPDRPAGSAPERPAGVEVSYEWPLPPGSVIRAFDRPDAPWLSGHRGVDLAGSAGDPVLAAGDGVVAFAGIVAGKAVVSIDHADGIRTTYEPVTSSLKAGDQVVGGEVIGTLTLGHGLVPPVHLGAKVGQDYLDPVTLIRAPVVIRLYPE